MENLEDVKCPDCGKVVGGYRVTLLNERPPQGALYPRIHNCPGDEMQVAPALDK